MVARLKCVKPFTQGKRGEGSGPREEDRVTSNGSPKAECARARGFPRAGDISQEYRRGEALVLDMGGDAHTGAVSRRDTNGLREDGSLGLISGLRSKDTRRGDDGWAGGLSVKSSRIGRSLGVEDRLGLRS